MGKNRKISEKEFLTLLRENAGLYSRTARAITKQFGITYTRQAVALRASKYADVISDIEEENIDIAEEGLHSLMRSDNVHIKMRAIEMFLKTKGKKRGYIEKSETDITSGGKTIRITLPTPDDPADNA